MPTDPRQTHLAVPIELHQILKMKATEERRRLNEVSVEVIRRGLASLAAEERK